jgi:rare lipoprotein A
MRKSGLRAALVVSGVYLFLAGCAETQLLIHSAKRAGQAIDSDGDTGGYYKVGNPYQIDGIWYHPEENYEYDETGIASWYGAKFHGKLTANGEVYDMNALTAAHRTLPMPSFVRVTNLENGRSLVLKVNDRGPFAKGRIIDISRRGSQLLGFQQQGTARVRVQILADQSRAIAARMQNQDQLARVGSPITVDKMPKATVSAETLPVPDGASASTSTVTPAPAGQPAPIPQATEVARQEDLIKNAEKEPRLGQERVEPTSIFVQAGAFGLFENANKVRASLSPLGNVFLDRVLVNGRDLFRVRVGPIANVGEADTVLARVVGTGYPDARIIVD